MFEIVSSGGVVMIFLLILMALAMMIVGERFWRLRDHSQRVASPSHRMVQKEKPGQQTHRSVGCHFALGNLDGGGLAQKR